jgi:hypothetical protein
MTALLIALAALLALWLSLPFALHYWRWRMDALETNQHPPFPEPPDLDIEIHRAKEKAAR